MGGEKPYYITLPRGFQGSPPRGRGKACKWSSQSRNMGITPAWAGKSAVNRTDDNNTKDHPRVGGEKSVVLKFNNVEMGSPPRGRGKVRILPLTRLGFRITPAWAGKSEKKGCRPSSYRDHPRVGGEKMFLPRSGFAVRGSPPRGRGKGGATVPETALPGITPAWAGKRLKRSHRSGIFISGPIPFHSVLHRPAGSGGSRAGRDGSPAGQPQNAGPA